MTTPRGQGKRLLVVEDEFMIATRIADILEGAGYEVIGPLLNAQEAMHAVAVDGIQGALLDLNLRGGTTLAIADTIGKRGIPILFVTGYARDILTGKWINARYLEKPFRDVDLLEAVALMLGSVKVA